MKRKITMILTVIAALALLAVNASADGRTVTASGYCGEYSDNEGKNVSYTLYSDGELEISGSGEFVKFYFNADLNDSVRTVLIEEGVTAIPQNAFSYYSNLISVEIPETVTGIGSNAFYECGSLTEVTIPERVTTIGDSAFYDCTALTNVEFQGDLESIGDSAFSRCSSLTAVEIQGELSSIGHSAFNRCSSLTTVEIRGNVDYVSHYAFQECGSLTTVKFRGNVGCIGDGAFRRCSSLTSIEFFGDAPTLLISPFPDSFDIGVFTIYYHKGASGWSTPEWNGYYASCVADDYSDLSTLDDSCHNAQNILFTLNDDSNTAIVGDNSNRKDNSDYFGTNDGNVIIPDTVTRNGKTYRVIGIGQNAFNRNSLLKTVALGVNVSSVDPTAFTDCPMLSEITVDKDSKYYSAQDGILFDKAGICLYCYPGGKEGSGYTVPGTVKTIGTYAFQGNSNLLDVTVPDTVNSIGRGAFASCERLHSITLPFIGSTLGGYNGFEYIFIYSYMDVPESLKEVTITGGTLKYGDFRGCSNIERITLPGNDTEIPYNSFYNCAALKYLSFDGDGAPAAEGVVRIPAKISEINYSAFQGCTGISEFLVDGDNSGYCSDKWGVLYSKDMKTLMSYPAGRKWPYYNVSDRTTQIVRGAFTGCGKLVNLYIPKNAEQVEGCISACPGMTLCAWLDSPAYSYAEQNSITVWPMDNFALQGIEVYSLPEKTVMKKNEVSFDGLYMVMNGGKALQLEDYEISYDAGRSGVQTVRVYSQGNTAEFDIMLYGGSETIIDFGNLTLADGTSAFAAVYDGAGRMLEGRFVTVFEGKAQVPVPNAVYAEMSEAKLFSVRDGSFAPVGECVVKEGFASTR